MKFFINSNLALGKGRSTEQAIIAEIIDNLKNSDWQQPP